MSQQPNMLFIMSDDHAAHAISSYGSRINQTPNIDRIAAGGMRFDNCFCTNSICTPSRAVILTGQYSHKNGVKTLRDKIDSSASNVAKLLQNGGYQTAIVGKWHLGHGEGHDPSGFDYWNVLPGQGDYHDPAMIEMGKKKQYSGYVTDLITDISLDWIKERDKDKPFFLMCHHKAPHRNWQPDKKHMHLYENIELPEPETFYDDYSNRAAAAKEAKMRIDEDLHEKDLKGLPPEGLTPKEVKQWKYQRYIKDYLRCVASVDDNVGRMLDYLDEEGIADNTIVIYTSDQGFFLGDHGWYDKRFMYEESLRMPLLIRYPKEINVGSVQDAMALNVDFAPTFLDFAGLSVPEELQGNSLRSLLQGHVPADWQTSMYYRYWEHMSGQHQVGAHYGVRTHRYKLIYYYGKPIDRGLDVIREPEWEMFDLQEDPYEMNNVYADEKYQAVVKEMKEELFRLCEQIEDFDPIKLENGQL